MDGLKQSFQCKVLQLHFEAEEERMVDSERRSFDWSLENEIVMKPLFDSELPLLWREL